MALQRLEDQERDLENQLTETTENLGRLEQDRSHEQESRRPAPVGHRREEQPETT